MHELLPWYVNGTLGAEATASFAAHLADCGDCRREMDLLEKMRAQVERHGEAVLSEHPAAEELVAAVTGSDGELGLPAGRAEEVRRHIALCASCADEARWVLRGAGTRGESFEEAGPATPAQAGVWRWLWPWLLPVAATIVLLVFPPPFLRQVGGPERTGVARLHLVDSAQRAGDEPAVVVVAPDDEVIRLVFPVDASSAMFPLQLRIVDAAGRQVRQDEVRAGDLVNRLFVLLIVSRDDCPDGSYRALLSATDGSAQAVEYPFRVTSAASPP